MLYNLAAIAATEKRLARKTIVGHEKVLFVSTEEVVRVGEIEITADNPSVVATWTPDPVNTIPVGGYDLQIVSLNALAAAAAPVITITGTDTTDAALNGVATFNPPAWSELRNLFNFAPGMGFDLTPSVSTKLFKTVASVAATNVKRGARFRVLALPTAWTRLDKVEGISVQDPMQPGISVPEGFSATDEVVLGRAPEQTLSVQGFTRGVADGLKRFGSQPVSLMMKIYAGSKIHKETQVFGNCMFGVSTSLGSGSDLATTEAAGLYEEFIALFAL